MSTPRRATVCTATARRTSDSIALRCAERLFHAELGYWLAESVWGRGFATEAIELADYLAFHHLSATVVTAEVFVGNAASCRVLERNGFRRERSTLVTVDLLKCGAKQFGCNARNLECEHSVQRPKDNGDISGKRRRRIREKGACH